MRVFVTGFTGSGKTTLSKRLSSILNCEYISFDSTFNYESGAVDFSDVYRKMYELDSFVLDAVPTFDYDITSENLIRFSDFIEPIKHSCRLIYVYSSIETWECRMRERMKLHTSIESDIEHLKSEFFFYCTEVKKLIDFWRSRGYIMDFYNSESSSFTTSLDFFSEKERACMDLQTLRSELDSLTYDKYYQDIEILAFNGYSKSHETWAKILGLGLDWSGLTVCDLGCFHGYFSFKVEQMGAQSVTGLDRGDVVLAFSEKLKQASSSNVEFKVWTGGQVTPECDIALVLNMLNHCDDQRKTLENIRCKFAIFEIDPPQMSLVSEYFDILADVQGRVTDNGGFRRILYAAKK